MRDVFVALRLDVFIDLHHRGSNTVSETDNSLCTLQIIAEVTQSKPGFPMDPAVLNFSKQINAYVYLKLNEKGNSPFTGITRYPDVDLPGTALGSFTLNGAAIMLYEVRGVGSEIQRSAHRAVARRLMGDLQGPGGWLRLRC